MVVDVAYLYTGSNRGSALSRKGHCIYCEDNEKRVFDSFQDKDAKNLCSLIIDRVQRQQTGQTPL